MTRLVHVLPCCALAGALLCAAPARAEPPAVCGVPTRELDALVRFHLYWFRTEVFAGYPEGRRVQVTCLSHDDLVALAVKEVCLQLAYHRGPQVGAWANLLIRCDSTPQDLSSHLAHVDRLLRPKSTPIPEIWERYRQQARQSVSRAGGSPGTPSAVPFPAPAPSTGDGAATPVQEAYALPRRAPPVSQARRQGGHPFALAGLRRAVGELRSSGVLASVCPCEVVIPYHGADDPFLFVLTRYVDGAISVDQFRRDLVTGEPRPTEFRVNRHYPEDRAFVRRLLRQRERSVRVRSGVR